MRMSDPSTPKGVPLELFLDATDWVEKASAGDEVTGKQLMRWVRSSEHVRELLLALALDEQLRRIDPERRMDVDQLLQPASTVVLPSAHRQARLEPAPANPTAGPQRLRWRSTFAAAAVVAALLATISFVVGSSHSGIRVESSGPRMVTLADGSIITLAAASRLDETVDGTSRTVALDAGEATFEVMLDPTRPFRVLVGPTVLHTAGAKFDVHRTDAYTHVAVLEGDVRIDASLPGQWDEAAAGSAGPAIEISQLAAGESVRIRNQGGSISATLIGLTSARLTRSSLD